MSDEHPSDLRWDRLLAGELADADAAELRTHAATCATCADRLREITSQRDGFAERPMPMMFARAKRSRRWIYGAPVAALAAAAVVLLIVRRPAPEPGERLKGGGLYLFAGQPDRLVDVEPGVVVHPGGYVQAAYTADRDGYGAVLSKDGAGSANVYVPSGSPVMIRLPPGSKLTFPESTVLDDVLGNETIVVLWCSQPQPLEPLLAQLRTADTVTPPADCRASAFHLVKRGAQ